MGVRLRDANADDAEAIAEIYAHYVATSTATFDTEGWTAEGVASWFTQYDAAKYPTIVAVEDAGGGELPGAGVVGFAAIRPYHARAGYRFTVTNLVYVDPRKVGMGIGRMLMEELIGRCEAAGHHSIVALIAAEAAASLKLHEALGFERCGLIREAGWKFERWLDVVHMQRMLGGAEGPRGGKEHGAKPRR